MATAVWRSALNWRLHSNAVHRKSGALAVCQDLLRMEHLLLTVLGHPFPSKALDGVWAPRLLLVS